MFSIRTILVTVTVFAFVSLIGGAYWKGRLSASAEWELKWTQASLEASEKARIREDELQEQVDSARKSLSEAQNEISRKDILLRSLRSSTAGLRSELASYAASSESLAACGEKLRALAEITARGGELLAESQELVHRFATAHDRRASETQTLIEGWPR